MLHGLLQLVANAYFIDLLIVTLLLLTKKQYNATRNGKLAP
jgi:hypothetical protein